MSNVRNAVVLAVLGCLFAAAGVGSARGQMTIFNIPTTDTLERKAVFIEADFIAKPAAIRDDGYQTYGIRGVYGLDHKTEIGTNFYYTHDGGDMVLDFQLNLKRKIYDNEKHGFAIAAGAIFSTPVMDRRGNKPYVLFYSNASKIVKPLNGLRVTGGGYTIVGGGSNFGTKTGAMLGVEQPIAKRFSFIADWYSGRNRLGYAAAGINFNITNRQWIMAGYNFGNSGRGNNAFSVFYGYTMK